MRDRGRHQQTARPSPPVADEAKPLGIGQLLPAPSVAGEPARPRLPSTVTKALVQGAVSWNHLAGFLKKLDDLHGVLRAT